MKLFVVCGPQSSGNRMLGAAFVRAGCSGEGSTYQPKTMHHLKPPGPAMLITHYPANVLPQAMELGWQPELVMIIREPFAQTASAAKHGHFDSVEEALRQREIVIHDNVRFARHHSLPLHVVTYEGLSQDFFRRWFPTLGLRGDNVHQPLHLRGQRHVPLQFANQNGKHYV